MAYFISKEGSVIITKNKQYTPYDLSKFGIENWFYDKRDAFTIRRILVDYFPKEFTIWQRS